MRFSIDDKKLQNLLESGRIQIKYILDCEPIFADIAYCNGTLTYFDDKTLPNVLSKFKNVGMLCTIHNTSEDVEATKKNGTNIGDMQQPQKHKTKCLVD